MVGDLYSSNILDFKKLDQKYKMIDQEKNLTHKTGKEIKLFPYNTKYKVAEKRFVKEEFRQTYYQLAKQVSEKDFNSVMSRDKLFERLEEVVEVREDREKYLKNMIESVVFKEDELNLFHPQMLIYKTVDEKKADEFAKFMRDTLFNEKSENILKEKLETEPINVFEQMVVKLLPEPEIIKAKNTDSYESIFKYIRDLFANDLEFIMSLKQDRIEKFFKLMGYYYFFYVSQAGLKFSQFFDADYDTAEPIYFILDWEKGSRSRKGYTQGFKMIQNKLSSLFAHANTLEILNTRLDGQKAIYSKYEDLVAGEEEEFVEDIEKFIEYYRKKVDFLRREDLDDDCKASYTKVQFAIKKLYNTINYQFIKDKSSRKGPYDSYKNYFEEFVKLNLAKQRGSSGYMLNMTQDNLLFLTKLCLKDKSKLRLKDLWMEYEKRGIFFDQASKEAVVKLFDQLNILEKKSDSGDAQYVKSIL